MLCKEAENYIGYDGYQFFSNCNFQELSYVYLNNNQVNWGITHMISMNASNKASIYFGGHGSYWVPKGVLILLNSKYNPNYFL